MILAAAASDVDTLVYSYLEHFSKLISMLLLCFIAMYNFNCKAVDDGRYAGTREADLENQFNLLPER